jgi:hypothetical protein
MVERALRVLITCRELVVRAGSQLYTRDVAEALRELGHAPVVYSPRLGPVAEEMRSRGVAVIDRLDRLGAPPDFIHGQHHLEAMAAMLRFPAVPALFLCHGWLPWEEAPPHFPSLLHYVAVDHLRRDRLVLEHGIPESQVTVLPNFVDLDRFRPRPTPLPPRPRRALLLSNQASERTFVPVVERVCAASGIELTVAGSASGATASRPEELLAGCDLVFARGRAALEAMAVGAAVVLCDLEGDGPLVETANFQVLRDLNFGLATLRPPVDEERLRTAIGRYDPQEAARVRDLVRREAGRGEAVARLVALYRGVIATAPLLSGEEHARACLAAAARYVTWLGTYVATADERLAAIEQGRISAEKERLVAETRWVSAEEKWMSAEERLAETAATLHVLERSPFLRLRDRLLALRPLVAAWRAVKVRRPG